MSSLPTNHVLEIEPGERVLSLDFTWLHPPNSLPSLPSPFFPPASHCFFVVIAGKSGAPPLPPGPPLPLLRILLLLFWPPFSFLRLSSTPLLSLSASVSPCRGTLPRFLQAGLFALAQREWILTRNWPSSEKRRHTLLFRDRPPLSPPPWRGLIPLNPIPPFTFPIPAAYNLPGRGRGVGLGWGESLPCAKMLTEVDTSPSGNCVG